LACSRLTHGIVFSAASSPAAPVPGDGDGWGVVYAKGRARGRHRGGGWDPHGCLLCMGVAVRVTPSWAFLDDSLRGAKQAAGWEKAAG